MDGVLAGIIGIAVIVGGAILLSNISRKMDRAVNRKFWSKGAYKEQQRLTGTEWMFQTTAGIPDIKSQLRSFIATQNEVPKLFHMLYVKQETDNLIVYVCGAKLMTSYTAALSFGQAEQRVTAILTFLQWLETDGVSEATEGMNSLVESVKKAFLAADPRCLISERTKLNPKSKNNAAQPITPITTPSLPRITPPAPAPSATPSAPPTPLPTPFTTQPTPPIPQPAPFATTPAPPIPQPAPFTTPPAPPTPQPAPFATQPAPPTPQPAPFATQPIPPAPQPAPFATQPVPPAPQPAPFATQPVPPTPQPAPFATQPTPPVPQNGGQQGAPQPVPAAADKRICGTCGASTQTGGNFCIACGTPLPVQAVTQKKAVTVRVRKK